MTGKDVAEKKTPDAVPTADSNDPTANVTAATLSGRRAPAAPSVPDVPPVDIAGSPVEETAVVVRDFSSDPEPLPAEQASLSAPDVEEPAVAPEIKPFNRPARRIDAALSRSSVNFAMDRDRQEVTLRMRYTAAIIAAFVVLVLIASAYVVGRHLGEAAVVQSGTDLVPTQTTKQIKNGPAQPGVLDVGRNGARLAANKIDGAAAPKRAVDPDAYEDAQIDDAGIATRTVNRNYVVIASYPPEMSGTAIKACDFLCDHGIKCTLERGLHRMQANWLCVVGIRGFPRRLSDNNDYLAYRKAITSLNDKSPGKANFGKFDPQAYKWDGN